MGPAITVNQPPFGVLTWNDRLHWWERSDLPVPLFSGRLLQFAFSHGLDGSQPIPPNLLQAAEAALQLPASALSEITPHVRANYRDYLEWVGENDIPAIADSEDIWAHVQAKHMHVDEHKGNTYVLFECDCSWEPEHGLVLVLLNGARWVRVNQCDGAFTDGRGLSDPSLDAWISDPTAKLPMRARFD